MVMVWGRRRVLRRRRLVVGRRDLGVEKRAWGLPLAGGRMTLVTSTCGCEQGGIRECTLQTLYLSFMADGRMICFDFRAVL
jgi:hypothetical protein